MHLHLIEPRSDGHRMQYVRRLVVGAPAHWTLSLSTFPGNEDHPAFQGVIAAGGGRLRIVPMAGRERFAAWTAAGHDGVRLQPAWWRLYRSHWAGLTAAARGDAVLVPYIDCCAHAIGLFGSPFRGTPWAGISMRQDFHWPEMGIQAPPPRLPWLKRIAFQGMLRARGLRGLVTIDPSLADWCARRRPRGWDRVAFVDDPSDLAGEGDRATARRHFGLPATGPVVLLFGAIDERKGLAALLDLASSPAWPAGASALVAGRCSPAARALLADRGRELVADGRVVVADRYLDRQEEWLAFRAADYGWLCYQDFYGPSGFLAQCRQAGLVPIHNRQGIIAYLADRGPALVLDEVRAQGLPAVPPACTGAAPTPFADQVLAMLARTAP